MLLSELTIRSARSIAIPGGWRWLTFITTTPIARRNIRVTSTASAMLSARCESARSPLRSIFSYTYANAQCAPSIACVSRMSESDFAASVHLAWAYVEQRFVKERGPQIKCHGDLIRRHREEHAAAWLIAALKMAQDGAPLEEVLHRFLGGRPAVE